MISDLGNFDVKSQDVGLRLDKFVSNHCKGLSYFSVQKLLRTGQIRVDGHRGKGSLRLELGNKVRIPHFYVSHKNKQLNTRTALALSKKIIDENILYKDSDMIAINKPSGVSVQGGTKIKNHIDGILNRLQFGLESRPQLVHRLDKDTSGVLLLARNIQTARRLTSAFRNKEIKKNYIAVVCGKFPKRSGSIKLPLQINKKNNVQLKEAVTEYSILWKGNFKNNILSIVEFNPLTGRKHQLRTHSYYMGCPILGDKKYKTTNKDYEEIKNFSSNMYLHAKEIGVPDSDGLTVRIQAPIPSHMLKIFELLNFKSF